MVADQPDTDLLEVARRVVWFKPPHQTLLNEVLFLNHAMIYGDLADVVTIRRHYDDDTLRNALRNAHPGLFDPRSWSYWHTVLGMLPVPPMPVRRLFAKASLPGEGRAVQGHGAPPRKSDRLR